MKRICLICVLIISALFSFAIFKKNPSPEMSKSLVFPVAGKKSNIGSFWGAIRDGGKRKHEGIDIFARKGTPILAIADGIIVSKANTPRGGKTLWLQPIGYPWQVYYAHLDQQKVRLGQFVKKGEVIGTVGNTGNARYTPAHLHFGIYTLFGATNPLPYVKHSPKISALPQIPVKKQVFVKSTGSVIKPVSTPGRETFPSKYVMKSLKITADTSAKYYVTTKSNVVRIVNGKLEVIGKWLKGSSEKYPYKITMTNKEHVNVNKAGKLINAAGKQVGEVS